MNDTQNIEMRDYFRAVNRNVIVRILANNGREFKNGIHVQEERGKKDVVAGVVEVADETLDIKVESVCWFPMYAATKLNIFYGDKTMPDNYYYVNYDDIILIQK